MISLSNVQSAAWDVNRRLDKISPLAKLAAYLAIGLSTVAGMKTTAENTIKTSVHNITAEIKGVEETFDNKLVQAQDNFADIDGFKTTSRSNLSLLDRIYVAADVIDFSYYIDHRAPIDDVIYLMSKENAGLHRNYVSKENIEVERRYAWINEIKHLRNIGDLTDKALSANYFSNNVVEYDYAKSEHGTNDPNWEREALNSVSWGKGVCVDQALAKYETLLQGGFPEEKMAIMTVGNQKSGFRDNLHSVVILNLPQGNFVMNNEDGEMKLIEVGHFLRSHRLGKDAQIELSEESSDNGLRPISTLNRFGANAFAESRTNVSDSGKSAKIINSNQSQRYSDEFLQSVLDTITTKNDVQAVKTGTPAPPPVRMGFRK